MRKNIYRLVSVYEVLLRISKIDRPVRLEIFRSLIDLENYRARIFVQNTYNLYPTFINIGEHGEDLHVVHSADHIDMDITSLVAEVPGLMTGINFPSEDVFLEYVLDLLAKYSKIVGGEFIGLGV
jgi:hypothetical protein